MAALHLADWQRATQARRVLVLATRVATCHRLVVATLAAELSTLAPPLCELVCLANASGGAGGPAVWSDPRSTPALMLLDGTGCSLTEVAEWLQPGVVDGLIEIRQGQSDSTPPAWECQRLAADIPLVGVVEIRLTPLTGSPRAACT